MRKNILFTYVVICLLGIFSCSAVEDNPSNEYQPIPKISVMPLSAAYAKTSINTSIFRCNSIASDDNFQIAAYYDCDGFITFAKRNVYSDSWEIVRSNIQQDCTDAHKSISIALDGDGYIHVAYGMHASQMTYRRSVSPYSFHFTPNEYMIDSVQEQEVTYPEFYRKSNGNLIFAYRTGYSGNGDLVLNEYSIASKSWKRLLSKVLDGESQRNAYWQISMDRSDCLHLSWVWRESSDVATNHDLCYAFSIDGQNWKNSLNQPYTIPIKMSESEVAWQVSQGSELINQTSMAADVFGLPYIATYWRNSADSVPQFRIVWNDGSQWHESKVCNRSTPFSLSGTGTKRIPVSRPKIVIDSKNRAFCLFRDIERGEVVSLAYCQDIGNPAWNVIDLTDFSVEAWEPTIDMDRWKVDGVLDIYVQRAYQGDGEGMVDTEPQMAYIIEVKW